MAPRLSLTDNLPDFADSQSFCFEKDDEDLQQPRRRTVSFAIREDILFYKESYCDTDNKENRWYSKLDMDQFKRENAKSAQAIVSGKHRQIANGCCEPRGLESVIKAGALQTKNRRKVALKAVLDEQRIQQQQQQRRRNVSSSTLYCDPDAIALAYARFTARSCLAAAAQGQSDALAVSGLA